MAERNDSGGTTDDMALMDAKDCAAILKISESMFYKLLKNPQAPQPILIGSLRRWRRRELTEWLDHLAGK